MNQANTIHQSNNQVTNNIHNTMVVPVQGSTPANEVSAVQLQQARQLQPQLPIRSRDRPIAPTFRKKCGLLCNRRTCKFLHDDQLELYASLIPTLPRNPRRRR
ncbi:hypothetical protein DM02DRAFT_701596 [Periconia macrospinosa]|uniref:Uncharacterized protein n=1 Tax=Periconia macrospinosa TaxID=97972 RepID=A0A2V1D251_9PLEO|nr:hypothetical protein DM02DRAFT_701596 [Periconia macrospinosa]